MRLGFLVSMKMVYDNISRILIENQKVDSRPTMNRKNRIPSLLSMCIDYVTKILVENKTQLSDQTISFGGLLPVKLPECLEGIPYHLKSKIWIAIARFDSVRLREFDRRERLIQIRNARKNQCFQDHG
jgi:hypothetical protein